MRKDSDTSDPNQFKRRIHSRLRFHKSYFNGQNIVLGNFTEHNQLSKHSYHISSHALMPGRTHTSALLFSLGGRKGGGHSPEIIEYNGRNLYYIAISIGYIRLFQII
jgi:hypothetical protein